MTASSTLPAPNLMPLMRYRDLAGAMSWLEQAFDFEKQTAVADSDGAVIYGQMSYRGGLMMMGAVRDTDLDKLLRQPDEVGGVETQSCYLVVEDADAHYARALEAGAEIVLELKSDGLGRRGYSCRDPEGHIWSFGTYSPGRSAVAPAAEPASESDLAHPAAPPPRRARMLVGLAALLLGLGGLTWFFADAIEANLTQRLADTATRRSVAKAEAAYAELVKVRAEKRKADHALQALGKDLAAERARRQAAETAAASGGAKIAGAETAAKAAEGERQAAAARIAEADAARKAAEAEAGSAAQRIAAAEAARKAAEAEAATLRDALAREKAAHAAAVEARRISEEKLAVQAAAKPERRETAPPPGPQSHTPKAASDDAARTAARDTDAPPRASTIETSATQAAPPRKPAPPRATDDDKDDERPAKKRNKTVSRAHHRAKAKTTTSSAASSPARYPAYHVDVSKTWPYNGWTR